MITIKELYDWAVEHGCENRELITVHSYDFDEDPGDQKIEKIAGINVYLEFEKE